MHAFYQRIRARRGHGIAVVAVARKLAVLFWCLLSRDEDYAHQQPSLTAKKLRLLEIRAGAKTLKGTNTGLFATRQRMRQAERELAQQAAEASYKRTVADRQAAAAKKRAGASVNHRSDQPPPPRPRRESPAQLRASPPRRQQSALGPRHRRLPRTQTGRRQVAQRSAPLPQTPPRPPRLETPPHPASTHRFTRRPADRESHDHRGTGPRAHAVFDIGVTSVVRSGRFRCCRTCSRSCRRAAIREVRLGVPGRRALEVVCKRPGVVLPARVTEVERLAARQSTAA